MNDEVLLTGDFLSDEVRARLQANFKVCDLLKSPPPQQQSCENIGAVITTGHHGAGAELMDALPNLKVIACYGVGYDGIDVEAATARNIWVTNTPDVLNDDVADLALGLMLSITRRIPSAERYVREGKWQTQGDHPTTDRLTGKRLGMLGMGRIGGAIVRRALAFDMKISYHATAQKKDSPHQWAASAQELAEGCDILCAAMPATAATEKIVNAEVLRALGAKGYLINIGRGALVDEPALVSALREGAIAGAALDVFADEPHVPEELKKMENVVLSPHQGSATIHTRNAMGNLAAENVERVLRGEKPQTPVNNPNT